MVYLLDTNIVTAILKRNEKIGQKLAEVSVLEEELFISCITYYEIKRGLLRANATRQISEFNEFCQDVTV